MSPSFASSLTKAGSFFSSPGWKRVFSRSSTSPSFRAATAFSATGPTQVVRESDRDAEVLGEDGGDGPQTLLRIASLRAPEMREQHDLAALAGDLADRRQHALDARRIGHAAVLHRHVEVDAHQHALAARIEAVEGAEALHSDVLRV